MFGYDFLLDRKGEVWLLEVNSSPSMDKSNFVLERMIKEMSESYIDALLLTRTNAKLTKG